MVLNQNGIFSRAEQATDKYGQSKARETLELALGEAQMQKYEQGLTDEQLTEKINEIGEELEERETTDISQAIVDGYIFLIDRTVPKILDYIGPANGVVITATISRTGNWSDATVKVSGTIKTYSGGTITNSKATKGGIEIPNFPANGGKYTIDNITEDTTIVIDAEDSNGKRNTKTIPITIIRVDNILPVVKNVTATANILTIKFSATGYDNESGLNHFNYTITSVDDQDLSGIPMDKRIGTFIKGEQVEINATKGGEYTITVIAEDNAGNKSESKSQTVGTWGSIKHIKTPTGLQEVNALDVYGADVTGYSCTRTGVNWQIFYIDEEDDHRVYLISKDYMAPPTIGTELSKGKYSHAYYWNTTVLNKYIEPLPTSNTINALGKFMGKFLKEYAGEGVSSKGSLQATSYMLDQSVWSEYLNINKADCAFGGPTIPLFKSSYNDVCKLEKKLDYKIANSREGYVIRVGTSSWYNEHGGLGDITTQNGIYFKGTGGNPTWGIWLASPGPANAAAIYSLGFNGVVDDRICKDDCNFGFRPIISLKSDVQFTANEDGSYKIN